jgi:hypothetical protein
MRRAVKSQAEKITELEAVYTDLKHEKENVIASYQRLSEKHKTFTKKAEQEKIKLAEAHVTKVARIQGELDGETQGYTDYCMTMCRHLCKLQETVASSFDEVKARCLPLPAKGAKVEEMID